MTVTADDQTQPLRRPDWDGPTDAFPVVSNPVSVPAPMPEPVQAVGPTRYTPAGDAKSQLEMGNVLVGIAVAATPGSVLAALWFDMHPAGHIYGYLWVVIGLVTCIGFKTEDTYDSEKAAWDAGDSKMWVALISIVLTAAVWLIPFFVW